jgi:hypothetical protein
MLHDTLFDLPNTCGADTDNGMMCVVFSEYSGLTPPCHFTGSRSPPRGGIKETLKQAFYNIIG